MGNTGDAEGTPYHLHFEVHPGLAALPRLRRRGRPDAVPRRVEPPAGSAVPDRRRLGAAPAGRRRRRRSRARSCSACTDISTADGLDPASLERALTPLKRVSADADAGADGRRPRDRPRPRLAGSCRRSVLDRRIVAAEIVVPAADHVLDPLARLRAGDRVEEDAERDARDQQRRVAAVCSFLPCSRSAALRRSSTASFSLSRIVVVGRDARGQRDRTAAADQLVVQLLGGR